MIYFDNAASTFPKPPEVLKGVSKWLTVNGANPGRSGHPLSLKAADEVFETRCEIANFFGVSAPEKIVFVPNATYGLNILIQGLLRSGDHVITTDLEHNSVLRPLHYMHKKYGVQFDVVNVDLYDDVKTVERIVGRIKKETRFIICTRCSNLCGKILPVELISRCIPDNIRLIVDGSQGAGVIYDDFSKTKIDYYCAPSHKGLFGIQGSGFIIINNDMPTPIICGGTGSDGMSVVQPQYLPDAFENGTLATPAVLSMKYGIRYINKIGIDNIYNHKIKLQRFMNNELNKVKNVIQYTDCEKSNFVGSLCFNINNVTSDLVSDYLSKNGICVRSGFHCAPFAHKKFGTEKSGAVRVSFSFHNTAREVERFCEILNKY